MCRGYGGSPACKVSVSVMRSGGHFKLQEGARLYPLELGGDLHPTGFGNHTDCLMSVFFVGVGSCSSGLRAHRFSGVGESVGSVPTFGLYA